LIEGFAVGCLNGLTGVAPKTADGAAGIEDLVAFTRAKPIGTAIGGAEVRDLIACQRKRSSREPSRQTPRLSDSSRSAEANYHLTVFNNRRNLSLAIRIAEHFIQSTGIFLHIEVLNVITALAVILTGG
jgi:hypothetical protein